jgi:ribulose-phosphate 3-epimerase
MAAAPPIRIAPSLLAGDFANLASEIRDVEQGGADWLHVDVMDGHFVPNLTIGPPVVASLKKVASVPLDVHLMITDPWRYADAFMDAGAAVLTFHAELDGDVPGLLERVHERGVKTAMVVNPATDLERVAPWLDRLDMVLVMSVFPGFGGQKFMAEVLHKVERLRDELGYRGDIEMDGGIDRTTVSRCASAGANVLVAGTAIFGKTDRRAAIAELRSLAVEARS